LGKVLYVPWSRTDIGFWFACFAGSELSAEICQPILNVEITNIRIALSSDLIRTRLMRSPAPRRQLLS
jgi:hypothetical protein